MTWMLIVGFGIFGNGWAVWVELLCTFKWFFLKTFAIFCQTRHALFWLEVSHFRKKNYKMYCMYRILAETEIAHITLSCLFNLFSGAAPGARLQSGFYRCTQVDSDVLTPPLPFHPNIQGSCCFSSRSKREIYSLWDCSPRLNQLQPTWLNILLKFLQVQFFFFIQFLSSAVFSLTFLSSPVHSCSSSSTTSPQSAFACKV